jgi:hypothetical protein
MTQAEENCFEVPVGRICKISGRDAIQNPPPPPHYSSRPALGSTQLPIQWVPGAPSPEVKRPGHEADHSPPASTEVKKMYIYIPFPHTPSWRKV